MCTSDTYSNICVWRGYLQRSAGSGQPRPSECSVSAGRQQGGPGRRQGGGVRTRHQVEPLVEHQLHRDVCENQTQRGQGTFNCVLKYSRWTGSVLSLESHQRRGGI